MTPVKGGVKTSRRTVLTATGSVAVTVLGAGCTGDDTGPADSDGSNEPGEDSTETTDEETETTTETETATETEEPTTTAEQGVPADLQDYADDATRGLHNSNVMKRFATLQPTERNRCYFEPVEGEADSYRQVIDVWLKENFPALADHSPASLVEETNIENGLAAFVSGYSNEDYPHQDRVTEHVYHVQQGPDASAPFAALTVHPTFGTEFKEEAMEEYDGQQDQVAYLHDQFGEYLKDNLDIHA